MTFVKYFKGFVLIIFFLSLINSDVFSEDNKLNDIKSSVAQLIKSSIIYATNVERIDISRYYYFSSIHKELYSNKRRGWCISYLYHLADQEKDGNFLFIPDAYGEYCFEIKNNTLEIVPKVECEQKMIDEYISKQPELSSKEKERNIRESVRLIQEVQRVIEFAYNIFEKDILSVDQYEFNYIIKHLLIFEEGGPRPGDLWSVSFISNKDKTKLRKVWIKIVNGKLNTVKEPL